MSKDASVVPRSCTMHTIRRTPQKNQVETNSLRVETGSVIPGMRAESVVKKEMVYAVRAKT